MTNKKILIIAFSINLMMMALDIVYGLIMNSSSLLGDAAHNSGDAFILGTSILVVFSKSSTKNKVSALKGFIMLGFGIWTFYLVFIAITLGSELHTQTLLLVGIFSLVGNVIAAILTYSRHFIVKYFLEINFDASGAYRCFSVKKIRLQHILSSKNNDYAFFWELTYNLHKKGYSIFETPVELVFRKLGKSKMRLKHIINSLFYLFKIYTK